MPYALPSPPTSPPQPSTSPPLVPFGSGRHPRAASDLGVFHHQADGLPSPSGSFSEGTPSPLGSPRSSFAHLNGYGHSPLAAPPAPGPAKLPPRNHVRSRSAEDVHHQGSFIFVNSALPKATPEEDEEEEDDGKPVASTSSSTLAPPPDALTMALDERRRRQIRLYGFSPALKNSFPPSPSASPSIAAPSARELLRKKPSLDASSDPPTPHGEEPTSVIPFPSAAGPASPPRREARFGSVRLADDPVVVESPTRMAPNGAAEPEPSTSRESTPTSSVPFPTARKGPSERFRLNSGGMKLDFEALSVLPRSAAPTVRKKSGELVKSSMKSADSRMRAKSAPSTPVGPKAVHFDSQLEHVKLFLAQQRPTAVSRDGSPIETETEEETDSYPFPVMEGQVKLVRQLMNFPPLTPQREASDVYLDSLDMAADSKALRGVIVVKNIAFSKWVAVRFTLDQWQTVSEVSGEYIDSVRGGKHDRFAFIIKLHDMVAKIEDKTLYLCIRYSVDGREIWDNNSGANYQVIFQKIAPRPANLPSKRAQSWTARNAADTDKRMGGVRQELERIKAASDEEDRKINFKTHTHTGSLNSALSSRYDFGVSLRNSARAPTVPSRSLLDNPYFASPAASPMVPDATGGRSSPPKSSSPYLTLKDSMGGFHMSGGMPASTYQGPEAPATSTPGAHDPSAYGRRHGVPVESDAGYFGAYGWEPKPFPGPATGQSPSHEWPSSGDDHFSRSARFNSFPPANASHHQYFPIPAAFAAMGIGEEEESSPSPSPPKESSPMVSPQLLPPAMAAPSPPLVEPATDADDASVGESPLAHELFLTSPADSPASTMTSSPPTPVSNPLPPKTEKSGMGSDAFADFTRKFCFFAGAGGSALGLTNTAPSTLSPHYSSGSSTPSPRGGSPAFPRAGSPVGEHPAFGIQEVLPSAVLSL